MAAAVEVPPSTEPSLQAGSVVKNIPEKPAEDCGCDVSTPAPVTDQNPTAADLSKASQLPVLDASGKSYKFNEIYDSGVERHLIVFIRHFFCGYCRDYIRTLNASITPSSLPSNTRITIIGCGDPGLISSYVQSTNCAFPLYVDPTRELYRAFNLARTLNPGEKPEYMKSMLNVFVTGVVDGIKAGSKALKGGDWSQVGGEFLFVRKGSDWEVEWCHRAKTTRDHTGMQQMKNLLGVKA